MSAADGVARSEWAWGAAASAFAVTAASVLGAWPGIGALDAGDFATASATLGVPHATGFPLYTMAGYAATLVPLGAAAWRVAVLSAFCAGVAAGATVWVVASALRLRAGVAAVVAAVVVVFLRLDTLVLHARVAEVYTLQLALCGLALVSAERLWATGDLRWRAALALCVGLGLANHALFRLWAPLFVVAAAVFVSPPQRRQGWGRSGWVVPILVGTLALLAYLYLPAAALRQPSHNWGDPSSLSRWWAHVTAQEIRLAYADEMAPTPVALWHHTSTLARQLWQGLGLALPLAAVGLWVAGTRARGLACLLGALAAVEVGYAVALNPMGLRDVQCGQLTGVLAGALGGGAVGVGVERLLARVTTWRGRATERAATLGVALAGALALMAVGGGPTRFVGSAADRAPEDVAATHLAIAAPESLTLTVSDTMTATLLYASVVLDARPDAAVLGRHLLSSGAAAARAAEAQPFEVVDAAQVAGWSMQAFGGSPEREAAVLRAALGVRAVYWEPGGSGSELPAGVRLVHRWPLGIAALEAAIEDECVPLGLSYCGEGLDVSYAAAARDRSGRRGWAYRVYLSRQWGYRGGRAFAVGRFDEAGLYFERASGLAPENPVWLTGVAVSLASVGRLEEALTVQRASLRLGPLSATGLRNARDFARALGLEPEAASYERRLRRLGVEPG